MRTLAATSLAVILCLALSGLCVSQQSSAISDNSSSAAPESDACGGVSPDAKGVHVYKNQQLLIHKVAPLYPKGARKHHIEGTVVMCASISKEGTIQDLRAVSGPPELVPSSLKAVRQWRYKPFLLNGEPVEVLTEIRVNYVLTP